MEKKLFYIPSGTLADNSGDLSFWFSVVFEVEAPVLAEKYDEKGQ